MGTELTLGAAFLVGLLGSTHCIGMCGGIVGALTLGLDDPVRRSSRRLPAFLLAYNSGRILSYSIAGGLSGLLGGQFARLDPGIDFPVGGFIAGLFMIALGFYLTGWWQVLLVLEKLGARLWRHIEPLGRRLLPVTSLPQAFALGMLWGWLPCGLVYAALAWSLTTARCRPGCIVDVRFWPGNAADAPPDGRRRRTIEPVYAFPSRTAACRPDYYRPGCVCIVGCIPGGRTCASSLNRYVWDDYKKSLNFHHSALEFVARQAMLQRVFMNIRS